MKYIFYRAEYKREHHLNEIKCIISSNAFRTTKCISIRYIIKAKYRRMFLKGCGLTVFPSSLQLTLMSNHISTFSSKCYRKYSKVFIMKFAFFSLKNDNIYRKVFLIRGK